MLIELKREACEANRLLPAFGLVDLNFGNASAIDRGRGLVAIKPSGVDYETLRPADMVLVDLDGKVVEGRLRPSSDTPTHLVLYRGFPSLRQRRLSRPWEPRTRTSSTAPSPSREP